MDSIKRMRLFKHAQYQVEKRLQYLSSKYKLLLDPKYQAGVRIVRFVRKHLLKQCANKIDKDIEGKFFIRFDIENMTVGFDMRELLIDPFLPFEIDGTSYKLTEKHLLRLWKQWDKVDPESRAGIMFKQDREYERACVTDFEKFKKVSYLNASIKN